MGIEELDLGLVDGEILRKVSVAFFVKKSYYSVVTSPLKVGFLFVLAFRCPYVL